MPIFGKDTIKAAELKKFREQYVDLHKNLVFVVNTIGQDWTDEGYVYIVYKDAKVSISIGNDNRISVSVHHNPERSTIVFQEYLTLKEYIRYSKYRDDKVHDGDTWETYTKDDVIYKPGKWIEYVNGVLMQKAQQKIDELEHKKALHEQNIATKHDPIDDSDIFG